MSLYSRSEVAAELEKSKDVLAGLTCATDVSHAINILLSHIEHLEAPPAPDDWCGVPVTMPFLANLFDAYCGAEGHNLVVAEAHRVLGKKL